MASYEVALIIHLILNNGDGLGCVDHGGGSAGNVVDVPAPVPNATLTDGVGWVMTQLGAFESCATRCQRSGKTCTEDVWPAGPSIRSLSA